MGAHEHAPLTEVQGWSGLPAGTALFDTLLVYENYPVGEWSWPELELVRVDLEFGWETGRPRDLDDYRRAHGYAVRFA